MNIIDYKLLQKFEYVIHIADIHIYNDDTSLHSRKNEYVSVFSNLILDLKNNKNIKKNNTITMIAGDIFNDPYKDKGKTTPNAVRLFKNLIYKLSKLTVVVIIPGNHDNNIKFQNNEDYSIIDTLSSVLDGMTGIDKNIFYLKKTGTYLLGNCYFYTTSVFDIDCIKGKENYSKRQELLPKKINNVNGEIHICLLHCAIDGLVTQDGFILPNCTYKLDDITPYDFTMLGDWHTTKFFNDTIAYPGSLIQQNQGESIDKHGYILWDLYNKKGKFYKIPNDYGYVTLYS